MPRKRAQHGEKGIYAHHVLDFRPGIDVVIRRDGQGYLHDTSGLYEDMPVKNDVISDYIRSNIDKLTPQQAAGMYESTRTTPFLSPEGKLERMNYMMESGKVKLAFTEI